MRLLGIIRNGHVHLDQPSDLPDGTRTVSLVGDEFQEIADLDDYEHPMAPYDPEEAALIRERVLVVRAGGKTIPLDEAIKGIEEAIRTASRRA